VVWGGGYQVMEWWGTSGACPQVAGLAALLLGVDPTLTPAQVGNIIRNSCRDIGLPKACAGAGLIDCEAAIHQVAVAPAGPMPGRVARKPARKTGTRPSDTARKTTRKRAAK
jgi:subtilisin family serine protease